MGTKKSEKIKSIGLAALVGAVAFFGTWAWINPRGLGQTLAHLGRETYTATITDKSIKRMHGDDTYLIFTKLEDGKTRVFQNTDSFLEFKWDSSDVYGKLEVGKTYKIKTYGWRMPMFSAYENITDVLPIAEESKTN